LNATLDHDYYEKARKRTKQKKRLYFHFVLFLVGSVFFVLLNKVIKFHPELDWYVWVIFAWLILLILHFINVFVMSRFFGKEWERIETEKLIQKHNEKAEKLELKLQKSGTLDKLEGNS
jgi:NhaP-type Na+/H+ or K+/H+ antiporter